MRARSLARTWLWWSVRYVISTVGGVPEHVAEQYLGCLAKQQRVTLVECSRC